MSPSCARSRPTTTRCSSTPTCTAGHGGSSGRYDKFKETAFNYAFMFKQLGVEETAK
jgi:protease II